MTFTDVGNLIRRYAHLTDQEIEGYVENTLDPNSFEMAEWHLRHCAYCRKEVEILGEAFKDEYLIDDLNLSVDLARQEAIRILDRVRSNYSQLWFREKPFTLERSEDYPGLLKIREDLVLAEFEDAIDEDREAPGSCTLRMEGAGLNPIIVPMRDFKDVNDIYFEEVKLVAGTRREETQADRPLVLEPVFICHLPDKTLDVFSHRKSTVLFLRVT